jgi:hypothetical protein
MTIYEVITNAYVDQVIPRNDLIIYGIVALRESEVKVLITEGLTFLMCAEVSIMRFDSSAPVHTPGTSYVHKNSSPKELSQVISVAKQPDAIAHSNGLGNVD